VELFLRTFVGLILVLLWLLVLGRVVLSWVDPSGRSTVSSFIIQTTEPILAPVRRMLPSNGMLDLSTLVVLIVLSVLWRAVL